MVPRICRYKWHSNELKAHILGEAFYYLCSKCEVCHPGHTMLGTVVIWVKKRRVAAAMSCHHRPPFLKHCLSLRAWFTQTTCGRLRTCALARKGASPAHWLNVRQASSFVLPSSPFVTLETLCLLDVCIVSVIFN